MSDPIVTFGEAAMRGELKELVRRTVEDTPNALLEEEADDPIEADRYDQIVEREAYRAGHCERGLTAASGQVALKMPKLKGMRFATAIVERCRRRETSVEEAMIEMHLAGVPTGRIEDVSEILWGASVSAATASNLSEKAFEAAEERRSRPLTRSCPHVFAGGIYLKRAWGGAFENAAAMAAIGVNGDGHREVIGAAEGLAESSERWREFLSRPKGRGLSGARMLAGDKAAAMTGAVAGVLPDAAYRRRAVRLCRNALSKVPESKRGQAAAMLKAIHSQESLEASMERAAGVAEKLEGMKLQAAARCVRDGVAETLACTGFPCGTGGASAPTTPSRGSTARSGGARGWWARFPMGGAPSCW